MHTKRVFGRGINLGKHGKLEYDVLHEIAEEQIEARDRLHELGEKFVNDKKKLEDALERIQSANIGAEDKKTMIDELNTAIDALEAQYKKEVEDEEARVQEETEDLLEQINQAIDEFTRQADLLRGVTMDVASADATLAADVGDTKKQELEQMLREYEEELRRQMERSDTNSKIIHKRR